MATIPGTLPEGTDSIIAGASVLGDDTGGFDTSGAVNEAAPAPQGKVARAAAALDEKTAGIRAKATDKARDYATQGKDKATGALDGVVGLFDEAAATLDEKLGAQYGGYARKAAEAVAGIASTLRDKDVDDLFADARALVKNNPAVAIGAAAAIGFVLSRVVKSATGDGDGADTQA